LPAGSPQKIVKLYIDGDLFNAKMCTVCKETKPLFDFYRNRLGVGGRNARCKCCESSAKAIYRKLNEDKEKSRHKKYRVENYDKCRNASAKWARENPLAMAAIQHRKRAKHLGLPATITKNELGDIADSFQGKCALSGAESNLVWDHFITLSTGKVGSVKENMILIVDTLNRSKGDKNPFEWFTSFNSQYSLETEKFDKLIDYLAKENDMSKEDYIRYVNECYAEKERRVSE